MDSAGPGLGAGLEGNWTGSREGVESVTLCAFLSDIVGLLRVCQSPAEDNLCKRSATISSRAYSTPKSQNQTSTLCRDPGQTYTYIRHHQAWFDASTEISQSDSR
jgi:hypothetical protein